MLYEKLYKRELYSSKIRPFCKDEDMIKLSINTAPANKLLRLSRVLGCSIEDLLEVED